MEETEILRTAQTAIQSLLVVLTDGRALAKLASRSLPFVLTNSTASTRNAGVQPTAMTAVLVLVMWPRSDRGRRRILRGVLADAAFIPEAVVEGTEILRTAHSAIPSLLVVGADGVAFAHLAGLSPPFVFTN